MQSHQRTTASSLLLFRFAAVGGAAAFALAGVFAFAAIVRGFAAALSFAGVLAFTGVLVSFVLGIEQMGRVGCSLRCVLCVAAFGLSSFSGCCGMGAYSSSRQ